MLYLLVSAPSIYLLTVFPLTDSEKHRFAAIIFWVQAVERTFGKKNKSENKIMKKKSCLNTKQLSFSIGLVFISFVFGMFSQTLAQRHGDIGKTGLPNGTEMNFVYLEGGAFWMGNGSRFPNEKPEHQVRINQGFWMQQTEVTQRQWKAVMGGLPASPCLIRGVTEVLGRSNDPYLMEVIGDNKPVMCVTWNDAQQFMQKLNSFNDGFIYSLPTEAEWEFACKAGTDGDYSDTYDSMVGDLTAGLFQDVAAKRANPFGLFDMLGNVGELVHDWYAPYPSTEANRAIDDPPGPSAGDQRISRGGNYGGTKKLVTSTIRILINPDFRSSNTGFRVVKKKRICDSPPSRAGYRWNSDTCQWERRTTPLLITGDGAFFKSSITGKGTANLFWQPISGMKNYEIQIEELKNNQWVFIYSTTVTHTNGERQGIQQTFSNGEYRWRVSADGYEFSAWRRFIIRFSF